MDLEYKKKKRRKEEKEEINVASKRKINKSNVIGLVKQIVLGPSD